MSKNIEQDTRDTKHPETASGCCGGPVKNDTDACCQKDADAKAQGKSGCGCNCR